MCPVSPVVLLVSPSSLPLCISIQVSRPQTLLLHGLFWRAQCLLRPPV